MENRSGDNPRAIPVTGSILGAKSDVMGGRGCSKADTLRARPSVHPRNGNREARDGVEREHGMSTCIGACTIQTFS
jgi:hypothetical protein